MVKKPTATFAQDASERLKKQTNLCKSSLTTQNTKQNPTHFASGFFVLVFVLRFGFYTFFDQYLNDDKRRSHRQNPRNGIRYVDDFQRRERRENSQ